MWGGGSSSPLPFLGENVWESNKIVYWRCQTCGRLLTDSMIADGSCAGHHLKPAIRGTFWEWLKIKLGILK